ncbi:hypothetical protein XENOCAPTIV_016163 [Xenoophorus captivus]|uniref:Vomeronasal type-1 receptor n=1 Tax=Xenoophorus captivus TaxID=1517983 RepID=A0ABV0R912_9TELE
MCIAAWNGEDVGTDFSQVHQWEICFGKQLQIRLLTVATFYFWGAENSFHHGIFLIESIHINVFQFAVLDYITVLFIRHSSCKAEPRLHSSTSTNSQNSFSCAFLLAEMLKWLYTFNTTFSMSRSKLPAAYRSFSKY